VAGITKAKKEATMRRRISPGENSSISPPPAGVIVDGQAKNARNWDMTKIQGQNCTAAYQ
jgi:hypothetical protein